MLLARHITLGSGSLHNGPYQFTSFAVKYVEESLLGRLSLAFNYPAIDFDIYKIGCAGYVIVSFPK